MYINHGGGGLVTQSCLTLDIPRAVAHQAPLSMGFSRQKQWSGLPFPSLGDLADPGIEPGSPALQANSLPTELQGKTYIISIYLLIKHLGCFYVSPTENSAAINIARASLVSQVVKNLHAVQETTVRFLGWENPLENGWATHSSIFGLPWWLSW